MSTITRFYVSAEGTLAVADFRAPTCRAEYYEDVAQGWSASPQALLDAMDTCQPLAWKVHALYENHRDRVVEAILQTEASSVSNATQIAELKVLLDELPEEPEEGAADWLCALPQTEFNDHIVPAIEQWFLEEPDWIFESDFLPETSSAQGAALDYFRAMDASLLDALGVEIIEGEHPGSTYYAAELRGALDEANRKAQKLKLPIRFERNPA